HAKAAPAFEVRRQVPGRIDPDANRLAAAIATHVVIQSAIGRRGLPPTKQPPETIEQSHVSSYGGAANAGPITWVSEKIHSQYSASPVNARTSATYRALNSSEIPATPKTARAGSVGKR